MINLDPCAIEENCFTGNGSRRVLRFSTQIANIGCEDYKIGAPPDNTSVVERGWDWHACHAHCVTSPSASNSLAALVSSILLTTVVRLQAASPPWRARLAGHYSNYAHYFLQALCQDLTLVDQPVYAGHKNGWCVADGDERLNVAHACSPTDD